jgi:DHA1 family bicyclomycin/chloramphenicol resistance-like MFS transporter
LPETLHPEYRLTLDPKHIAASVVQVLGNRVAMGYTLAMMVMFGALIAYVGMVQQIFSDIFLKPTWMPTMFALCAAFMGVGAFWNSRNVHRLGMRPIAHTALLIYIGVTALHTVVAVMGWEQLWTFVAFQGASMGCFALALSNFGAMAMEPVGEVAGVAASLQGFISTFTGAFVGAFIGKQFNGTTVPLAVGSLACGVAALLCVLFAERGKLFHTHHAGQPATAAPQGAELH